MKKLLCISVLSFFINNSYAKPGVGGILVNLGTQGAKIGAQINKAINSIHDIEDAEKITDQRHASQVYLKEISRQIEMTSLNTQEMLTQIQNIENKSDTDQQWLEQNRRTYQQNIETFAQMSKVLPKSYARFFDPTNKVTGLSIDPKKEVENGSDSMKNFIKECEDQMTQLTNMLNRVNQNLQSFLELQRSDPYRFAERQTEYFNLLTMVASIEYNRVLIAQRIETTIDANAQHYSTNFFGKKERKSGDPAIFSQNVNFWKKSHQDLMRDIGEQDRLFNHPPQNLDRPLDPVIDKAKNEAEFAQELKAAQELEDKRRKEEEIKKLETSAFESKGHIPGYGPVTIRGDGFTADGTVINHRFTTEDGTTYKMDGWGMDGQPINPRKIIEIPMPDGSIYTYEGIDGNDRPINPKVIRGSAIYRVIGYSNGDLITEPFNDEAKKIEEGKKRAQELKAAQELEDKRRKEEEIKKMETSAFESKGHISGYGPVTIRGDGFTSDGVVINLRFTTLDGTTYAIDAWGVNGQPINPRIISAGRAYQKQRTIPNVPVPPVNVPTVTPPRYE